MLQLPEDFESAWPWMRSLRKIIRTVSEPRLLGKHIISASDFSGSHKASKYNVYSYIHIDADQSSMWPALMGQIRKMHLVDRRMSFKALNDIKRQEALVPFLQATETLSGVCCVVAVTKRYSRMATAPTTLEMLKKAEFFSGLWNDRAFETAMRVVLIWSVIMSEVCGEAQNVMWVIDEDEIVANDLRHTDLLEFAGKISQMFIRRQMGALCVCTPASEGSHIGYEDLVAIPDLAAGAFSEAINHWQGLADSTQDGHNYNLRDHSAKCDLINDWFFHMSSRLRRVAVLIDATHDGALSIQRISLKSDQKSA